MTKISVTQKPSEPEYVHLRDVKLGKFYKIVKWPNENKVSGYDGKIAVSTSVGNIFVLNLDPKHNLIEYFNCSEEADRAVLLVEIKKVEITIEV